MKKRMNMESLDRHIKLLEKNNFNSHEDSYKAFSLIADGNISNEDIKRFLLSINKHGINEALLYGAAKSLNERSIKLKSPEDSIDVCGTGGDNSNSLNISTTVSIVLASIGVAVAKHGNKAVSSKSGSADIFSEIGIDLNLNKEEVEKSLFENNLAFIFAPLYHPALKNVAKSRQELGVRTIFNFLGPLLNPAQTKRQLIGCSDNKMSKIMLKTCMSLKKENCWVVTAEDGMDEISISCNTNIYKMDNNKMIYEILNPEDYGIKKRDKSLIEGKDPSYNAQKLIKLLKSEIDDETMQAYFDIVCLNTAAALVVANKFKNFNSALKHTQKHIKNKEAFKFLNSRFPKT